MTFGTVEEWLNVAGDVLAGKRQGRTDSEREAMVIGMRGLAAGYTLAANACALLDPGRKWWGRETKRWIVPEPEFEQKL